MCDRHDQVSQRRCRHCGTPLVWRRICFVRPDHYPDWYLETWCPQCGKKPAAADQRAVRAEFDRMVGEAIQALQEAALREAIGHVAYRELSATPATGGRV